jgi:hypothetical protein
MFASLEVLGVETYLQRKGAAKMQAPLTLKQKYL